MQTLLQNAKNAKPIIANLAESRRNAVLLAMAKNLRRERQTILAANKTDLENAANLAPAMLERLSLDESKVEAMAAAIEEIAALKSPLNRVLAGWENYCGLKIQKVSVPIGVVAVIYESRPNVTSDVAALCFKSGNVCILKGGSEALRSNRAILDSLHAALEAAALPRAAIGFVDSRESIADLLKEERAIDLVIPRGGEGLVRFVTEHSKIPVLKHDKGVCHLFIAASADREAALKIAINAKCQKSAACNSIETILVHQDSPILADLIAALQKNGVKIKAQNVEGFGLEGATEADFYAEYGEKIVNLKVIESLEAAIAHIQKHGSNHSESIVTSDYSEAQRFLDEVDAACVYVNASTRFSDGGEFGFGAEVGISTAKIHARGPMGLESLTTYKYKIFGAGQVR